MKKVAGGIYRKGDELYVGLEVDFLRNWTLKTKRLVSGGGGRSRIFNMEAAHQRFEVRFVTDECDGTSGVIFYQRINYAGKVDE